MATLKLITIILKWPFFLLIIFLLLFSGCSDYRNIPRQRSFFNAKSNEQPLKERVPFTSKNKKDEIVEDRVDSIMSKEKIEKIAQEDRNNDDHQQIKSKGKFVFNHPNNTFFKESIALAKSSLPKVFKFHETKKSSALKNKLAKRKAFPLVLIMLGVAIGLIGLIFGIGYLTEKINGPSPEVIPKKPIVETKPKRNVFACSSLVTSMISWIILIASIIILLLTGFNMWAFILLIFFFFISAILALIAIILGAIAIFQTRFKKPEDSKNRIVAISGIAFGVLMLLLFIGLAGPSLL